MKTSDLRSHADIENKKKTWVSTTRAVDMFGQVQVSECTCSFLFMMLATTGYGEVGITLHLGCRSRQFKSGYPDLVNSFGQFV